MIEKNYQPADIESRMSRIWEESGAFKAGRPERRDAAPFTIVIPPPNVTGSLHMGHALNNTLQDILCRFERMRGRDVLWQPGTDHAGIATQMVVERQLMERQEPGRRDMGRAKFLERVWQWKAESGGVIVNQLKRLGASCDWSRERFTMDEGLSRAVVKVFVELHREGLIYKDKRLVNWDPKLLTAISDLEVQQVEVKGNLWYLRYPIEGKTFSPDDPSTFVVVATTRPETMLGDTAVAIHPDNERIGHLIGQHVILPLVGRRIPLSATTTPTPRRDPARSRSRRRTTSTISRSASATACRRSTCSTARVLSPSSTTRTICAACRRARASLRKNSTTSTASRRASRSWHGWKISVSWKGSSRTRIWCRMATAPAWSSSPI